MNFKEQNKKETVEGGHRAERGHPTSEGHPDALAEPPLCQCAFSSHHSKDYNLFIYSHLCLILEKLRWFRYS